MDKWKVLVTDYTYSTLEPEREVLEKVGATLLTAQCTTEEEIIEAAEGVDGIISQYAPITRKVINNLDNCKVIARYGVGFDTIDINAATDKGILVCNVPDYCYDEVTNHAFSLLMVCARKIVQLNNRVKNNEWDYNVVKPIFRLSGRTLGLVGFGNIPQILVKKIQGFGLDIIVYDPFVSQEIADSLNVNLVGINELFKRSDFVSVHTPLNKNTRGMINDELLNLMKREAFIINTARGAIIDEKALIRALESERIAGAALDVLETEPISIDNPLLKMDNVILTPHSAAYSLEAEIDLKQKAAQNVADSLIGIQPRYIVNNG